jgi:hypothetical protein
LHLRVEPDEPEPHGRGRDWKLRYDGADRLFVDSVDGSDLGAYDQRR